MVIPVRDAGPLLDEQLAALAAQAYDGAVRVVVADNGSTDDSAERARSWAGRLDLRVVDAAGVRGVSHARNRGIAAADTDLVLVCDADDVVSEGWVAAMVAALATHDLVGGSLRVDRLNDPAVAAWRGGGVRRGLPVHNDHLPMAPGANTGMRRAVFEALGGYDEGLVAGGDDDDFSWRAQYAGFRIAFAPDALIDYRVRSTYRGVYRQSLAYARSGAALHERHRDHGMAPVRLRAAPVLWLVTRAPLAPWSRRRRGQWVRQLGTVAGTVAGTRHGRRSARGAGAA